MSAIRTDDTRELDQTGKLKWEPGKERWRKIAVTTAILLALAGIVALIMTR